MPDSGETCPSECSGTKTITLTRGHTLGESQKGFARPSSSTLVRLALSKLDLPERTLASSGLQPQGEVFMAGQVVLYFEDQADALRFALAAGSVMAGDSVKFSNDLVQGTTRVTRIRLDAVNPDGGKKSGNGRAA